MAFKLQSRSVWRTASQLPLSWSPRVAVQTPQRVRRYATPTNGQQKRTAIVTGSARGIGKAIALRLAQDGYDICVNDIPANKSGAEEVVSEIRGLGRNAFPFMADVSKLQEVQKLVEASVNELGPLNTMVANAGIAQVKALLDLTEEDLKRMFEINVYGVFNCYSTAAKQMIKQGNGGKLLGAASIVAFKPFALLSHYSASKWAVRGMTQAFAMEMAEHKITVNAYAPGIVGTAMWDLIDEELGKKKGAKKGDTIKKYSSELIALGRTSVPEDVSKAVSFLSSPDSDYMTGQTIVIDGGIIFT
ncbi:acetoin dehydrogenase-like protein [Lophiostoma macrostomum CBS 122681]|uniref:Acetoin dehydrogenase-like protein n=1 Tax=Lophiostoma macrostomum CBS 122681 TaxID=1314788 RepID=A0A6A6SPD6_9PLEO|nr:acetoin dehydrogenase-like protein [Lophiostoma macrostomum CBS 122681]